MKFALLLLALLAVGCDQSSATNGPNPLAVVAAEGGLAAMVPVDVAPVVGGKCPDCNGTGKVGDSVVFTTCLRCNGTGKLTSAADTPADSSSKPTDAAQTPCPCGPNCPCKNGYNPDCRCPKCEKCGRCQCQCECPKSAGEQAGKETADSSVSGLVGTIGREAQIEELEHLLKVGTMSDWTRGFLTNQLLELKERETEPQTPFKQSKAASSEIRVDVIVANFPCPPCKTWTDDAMPKLGRAGWKESQLRVLTWGDPETDGMTKPASFPAYYKYEGDALADFHVGLLDSFQIGDFYSGKPLGTAKAAAFGTASPPQSNMTFQSCRNCQSGD